MYLGYRLRILLETLVQRQDYMPILPCDLYRSEAIGYDFRTSNRQPLRSTQYCILNIRKDCFLENWHGQLK